MVNGFTANEIGDWFLVKLNEPYQNIVRVLDWEVQLGLTTPYTVGTLEFTQGSDHVKTRGTRLDWQAGDTFIVGNVLYNVVQRVEDNEFIMDQAAPFTRTGLKYYLPTNKENVMTFQYRWTQETDKNGIQRNESELKELNKGKTTLDLLGIEFDPSKPLWIDIAATVDRIINGNSITVLGVTYTLETGDGTIESCPQFCEECKDPWSFDGCANVVIECDPGALYRPYDLNRPVQLYQELSQLGVEIFGHEVRYFRVEPDQRSRDVILMEYSLYNVVEEGRVKVMVPNNEFPPEEFKFDLFGMGFEEFEIHITGKEFEKVFGRGIQPRMRDYLYIPFINKMYEVSTVSFADEFNQTMTYWRVMLKKYEDRTSSIHTDSEIEAEVDNLTVGVEEVFGEEQRDEFEKVTKPQQYQTTHHATQDGIRKYVHKQLKITDGDIRNRWTIISKNYYDLTTVPEGEYAVIYNKIAEQSIDSDLAFTCWFSPRSTNTFNNEASSHTLFEGNGLGDSGISISVQPHTITIDVNGIETILTHNIILDSKVWYGLVVNMSNTYRELGIFLYELQEGNNWGLPQSSPNTLELKAETVESFGQSFIWSGGGEYVIPSSQMHLTNIRLLKHTIEKEQHQNVLQQYVVRDAEHVIIADNAIPSIMLKKYGSNR